MHNTKAGLGTAISAGFGNEYEAAMPCIAELQSLGWMKAYPSLSALLLGLDCATVADFVTDKGAQRFRPLETLRSRWQSLGRPLLGWPPYDGGNDPQSTL